MEEKHFLMEVYFFLPKNQEINSEEIHQYLTNIIEEYAFDITAVETGFTQASI
jgi:Holliday junction resolvasome RuvABC endonuclease subunit